MNDMRLGSESEFDKTDDNDSTNQRDSIDMKITTAKPMAKVKGIAGDPNLKVKSHGPKR